MGTGLLSGGFLGDTMVKSPPANVGVARNAASIPGLGRSLGEGNSNPLQYSCLENPMTAKPGELQFMGLQRVRHNWGTSTYTHTHTHTQKVTVWGNKNFWKWMWWWLLNNVIGLNFSQYHILFTHSSIHGYLSHFHFLPIENNAAAYVGAQIFLWVPAFAPYGYTPRRRIPRSYGNPAWLSEESPYHLPQQLIHFTC